MLSLEDIAAIKIAIEICNDPELKRKILLAPDVVKISDDKYCVKQKWDEMVERQAMVTLESRNLPKNLQQKVMHLVPAIGMRMLTWAVYHEGTFFLSREYSIDFLNSSFFTQQGIIDNKKAAEELMNDKDLSIAQKFKIACLYCFTDHIPDLFKQMMEMVKGRSFGNLGHKALLRFWIYYEMGKADRIKGEKSVDQYLIDKAVQSGSKAAVEYCFEKTDIRMENDALVDAAVEAVRNRIRARDDWIVFRDSGYDSIQETWVPSAYYVDIVCFLLSKMTKDQQIEFLKKDIEGAQYRRRRFQVRNRSRVLEYFLHWPYQGYFMKTADLMWEFLPEKNYADLLLKICDKIEPGKEKNLKYVEEKNYDYRCLLKEFWYQSPERYKRYVLCNQRIPYQVQLLTKLLSLKKFTFEDGQIIGIILASAEDNEKENLLSSMDWRDFCIGLIEKEKLEILDRFVLSHFSSVRVNGFKRELVFSRDFQDAVFDFVENDKWVAAESALKWSSLSGEEVNEFKKEMICSQDGESICSRLILYEEDVEIANKFIEWCTASEEEIRAYKEKFIFSDTGMDCCQSLVLRDKLELMDKITNCYLVSQEKIKEFNGKFQLLKGRNTCEKLISGYSERFSYGYRFMFEGGKWKEVKKFLTWCFSSEEEIVDFKKRLLRDSGKAILLKLIKCSQWAEAETFFAWLGLSIEEIKKLKKDTVLDREFILLFYKLLSRINDDAFFVQYGSKKGAIELILRWCLTDKETVLEFKDKLKNFIQSLHYYEGGYLHDVLSNFDLIIEQHLKDIYEEDLE